MTTIQTRSMSDNPISKRRRLDSQPYCESETNDKTHDKIIDLNSTNKDVTGTDNTSGSEESEFDKDYPGNIREMLKESDPEAYNMLIDIDSEIEKTEPNLGQILREPLLREDKARLIQLYEIYVNVNPATEEWLEMRDKFQVMFRKCKREYAQYLLFSPTEHALMKHEEEKLQLNQTDVMYRYRILNLNTNNQNKAVIYRRFEEMKELSHTNEEYGKMKSWLDWAISLPHDNMKPYPFPENGITSFLHHVMYRMDQELYGMKNIKEQILLFLNSRILNPNMKKCSLGLVGRPGCGKTHLARLLANVLDYPFDQISFGGVSEASFVKGHEYTYIGAQPGAIIQSLRRMKYKNGILFLDEYEKIADNKEVCSALLHITDPIQNNEFRDSYMPEITVDLSHLWMIYSMNSLPRDAALRDRIFVIDIKGYTHNEKKHIVKDYLLPNALKNIGRNKGDIVIKDQDITYAIEKVSLDYDKGVRALDKMVHDICNKVNFLVHHQNSRGVLQGMEMSFDIHKKITYPVVLDRKMLDKLVISIEDDLSYRMVCS